MIKILALSLVLIFVVSAFSCGDTITGQVYISGNEPHTFVVLKTKRGEFRIVGPLTQQISGYQNQYIEVTGAVVKERIGPGFPAELRITSIIKVSSKPL